jgi:glycine/D-amino acid oxidase-like deaminating enzyme/nitrite reductase/ring-hydroxylating ferredoxin subunit
MPRSRSLWLDHLPTPHASSPLTADAHADVCVVGAGMAGLMTAYLLARDGRSVVVLDDGRPGGGQTAVTTAHLSYEIDAGYREIARLHGTDGARLAYGSHRAAIDRIEAIAQLEGIDCDFQRVSGYLVSGPARGARDIDAELEAAREAGVVLQRLEVPPVRGFYAGPCLHFPRQAQFHPLKFLAGLTSAVVRLGGRVHTNARVTSVEGGAPVAVSTADGRTVTAGAAVIATNVPFNDMFVVHTKQAPYHSYVVAARVPADAVTHALYWDTDDPYHYARLHRVTNADLGGDDRQPVDLLIVGGEDHKAGQAQDAEPRFANLETWMRAHFPAAREVEFRWSGQVMESQDGLAFIGRNPLDREHVYIATGDSGMGMTHGAIAGMLIADLVAGRENPWTDLYDPSRIRTGAAAEFVRENVNVARQYASWLTAGEVSSVDEIAPNSGAVLREGLFKIAVFRDEAGELHRRSAVCPHLGCIVAWNPAASTWDCPCHGSRFDKLGVVLNGPAASDLKAV